MTSHLRTTHLDHHSSQLERVSVAARMVTGLVSVKVLKLIQVIPE